MVWTRNAILRIRDVSNTNTGIFNCLQSYRPCHICQDTQVANNTPLLPRYCDGKKDCPLGDDETATVCQDLTSVTCNRRVGHEVLGELEIPFEWVCDGEVDCEGGEDEELGVWQVCGSDETTRRCMKPGWWAWFASCYLCG